MQCKYITKYTGKYIAANGVILPPNIHKHCNAVQLLHTAIDCHMLECTEISAVCSVWSSCPFTIRESFRSVRRWSGCAVLWSSILSIFQDMVVKCRILSVHYKYIVSILPAHRWSGCTVKLICVFFHRLSLKAVDEDDDHDLGWLSSGMIMIYNDHDLWWS